MRDHAGLDELTMACGRVEVDVCDDVVGERLDLYDQEPAFPSGADLLAGLGEGPVGVNVHVVAVDGRYDGVREAVPVEEVAEVVDDVDGHFERMAICLRAGQSGEPPLFMAYLT